MKSNEAADFILRLTALSELFNVKLSEAAQVLYFEALSDLEMPALIDALGQAAKRCKFMPKPVELRELAIGNIDDAAALAWNSWKEAARKGGSMRSLVCDRVLAE